MPTAEFKCRACGHEFGRVPGVSGKKVACPRCGSEAVDQSSYLLGTAGAEELKPEDYFNVALAPCCNATFAGWHRVPSVSAPPTIEKADTKVQAPGEAPKRRAKTKRRKV